jgi:hypothetical protein
LSIKDILIHTFEIRGGGKAALLLTKPAASGDAGASPQADAIRCASHEKTESSPKKQYENLKEF